MLTSNYPISLLTRPDFGLDNSARILVGLLCTEFDVGPGPLFTAVGRAKCLHYQRAAAAVVLLPSQKLCGFYMQAQ
jgi:hypothetical protein